MKLSSSCNKWNGTLFIIISCDVYNVLVISELDIKFFYKYMPIILFCDRGKHLWLPTCDVSQVPYEIKTAQLL
jgi:hypothetical protein